MAQSQAIPLVTGGTSFVERDVAGYRVTDLVFPAGLRLADHEHDRSSFVVMLEGAFDLFMLRRTLPCPVSTIMMEPAGEQHGNQVSHAGARVLVIQPAPAAVRLVPGDRTPSAQPASDTARRRRRAGAERPRRRLGPRHRRSCMRDAGPWRASALPACPGTRAPFLVVQGRASAARQVPPTHLAA